MNVCAALIRPTAHRPTENNPQAGDWISLAALKELSRKPREGEREIQREVS